MSSEKSEYEKIFDIWIEVGKKSGLVISSLYQPKTYTIAEKITYNFNGKNKTILKEIKYTPDYLIVFTDKFIETYSMALDKLKWVPYRTKKSFLFDIKSKWQGKSNGSNREFACKQRMLFDQLGFYVNRCTLDAANNLFYYTYAPSPFCWKYGKKEKGLKEMFKKSTSFIEE